MADCIKRVWQCILEFFERLLLCKPYSDQRLRHIPDPSPEKRHPHAHSAAEPVQWEVNIAKQESNGQNAYALHRAHLIDASKEITPVYTQRPVIGSFNADGFMPAQVVFSCSLPPTQICAFPKEVQTGLSSLPDRVHLIVHEYTSPSRRTKVDCPFLLPGRAKIGIFKPQNISETIANGVRHNGYFSHDLYPNRDTGAFIVEDNDKPATFFMGAEKGIRSEAAFHVILPAGNEALKAPFLHARLIEIKEGVKNSGLSRALKATFKKLLTFQQD
ncbi:MAG: hypothetical protein MRY21_00140 [Simkaniaceae bacterium]|nr:hypothetical protein [Simkaniaceae bacterium]